jgi:hypothetical protein
MMIRAVAAIASLLALAGCAEVTRFQRADGASYYHVDCSSTLRWVEGCQAAARRTCPSGYTRLDLISSGQSGDQQQAGQCLDDNRARADRGEAQLACGRQAPRKEYFFACRP